jgi:chemotaxis protein MotA
MFASIGILVVFGTVVGGYLLEHGNLKVLLQPAELLIIGGAGAGTVLVANPLHILGCCNSPGCRPHKDARES